MKETEYLETPCYMCLEFKLIEQKSGRKGRTIRNPKSFKYAKCTNPECGLIQCIAN